MAGKRKVKETFVDKVIFRYGALCLKGHDYNFLPLMFKVGDKVRVEVTLLKRGEGR